MRGQTAQEIIQISGRVEYVFYSSPRFTACRMTSKSGDSFSCAGRFFAQEGDQVVLKGSWSIHPKYGRQFQVTEMLYDLDLDDDGLVMFLATHPRLKGIGPVKARRLVDHLDGDLDSMATVDVEALAQLLGVKTEVILNVQDLWGKARETNRVMAWLAGFGLTHHQITLLVGRYGTSTYSILRSDPYLLMREVAGFGFKRVDLIARKLGTPKDKPERIRAGLLFCITDALGQGDCWVEFEELVRRANTLLVMDTLDSRERIEHELDHLTENGALTYVSHGGRFLLALPSIHQMESDLANTFAKASTPNHHFERGVGLDRLLDELAPELNAGQRHAAEVALSHSISLISGGAGSGKTFTISALTYICEQSGLEVVLCAPTGKAAKRLEQMTGHEASTIHRLLGYNGQEYKFGPDRPVEADLLIDADRARAEVPLAWQHFQAIDLSQTTVVLVGDHNQLPPVGPGNPLRDLITTRAIPTVVLDRIVRQAGVLKENSTAILSGEVRPNSEVEESGRRAWYRADGQREAHDVQGFIYELFDSILEERLGFDLLRDVQVLTPTHKGPMGTVALNELLKRLVQRKLWNVEVPKGIPGRRPSLLLHDKVIQTRNDYETGVMNGSIGTVVAIDRDGGLTIDFDGHIVQIEAGNSNRYNLELAYALSIHKSQGSEYPCTIVVVHRAHSFMHHRNLLYTAVTRAKQTAILVGDAWGMRNCARVRRLDSRRTFLSFLLQTQVTNPVTEKKTA